MGSSDHAPLPDNFFSMEVALFKASTAERSNDLELCETCQAYFILIYTFFDLVRGYSIPVSLLSFTPKLSLSRLLTTQHLHPHLKNGSNVTTMLKVLAGRNLQVTGF